MNLQMLAKAMLLALLAPVVPAAAQTAPTGSTDLQTEITRKRHIVRPVIDPATVARDAEEATKGVLPHTPSDAIARGLSDALIRRPDTSNDVVQGIQQQNINNAIRRR